MKSSRLRDYGLSVGTLPTGPLNAITDVAGIKVGHTTLISGSGKLEPGKGPIRTGVTVILPHDGNLFREKVRAACYTINGTGKICGLEEVRELGLIEAPIGLTGTLNVGLVCDAIIQHAVKQSPEIGVTTGSINVVVGETNDRVLNDLQGRHVRAEHVFAALESASGGLPQEGAVGAGTGTVCYDWKGGIGTSSRVLPEALGGYTIAALVQANFGDSEHLTVCGVPVGQKFTPPPQKLDEDVNMGSVIVILATDTPLTSRQLQRLCVRATSGLGRTGSIFGATSGDFVVGFTTAYRIPHQAPSLVAELPVILDERNIMSTMFHAVAECVEESVMNALFQAETMTGVDGVTKYAVPKEEIAALVKKAQVI